MLMLRAIALSFVIAAALAALETFLGVVMVLAVLVPLTGLAFALEAELLKRHDERADGNA